MSCTTSSERLSGSPTFDVNMFTGQQQASEVWRVPADDFYRFFSGLFPVTTIPNTSIIAMLGGRWDIDPHFVVSTVHVQPYGGERSRTESDASYFGYGSGPVYPFWDFHITYEVPAWESNDGGQGSSGGDPIPYIKHDWTIGSQIIHTTGSGSWQWVSASETPANPPIESASDIGIPTGVITHVLTWPKITNPPFAIIRSLENKVNDASITWRTGTVPAGAMVFRGADISEEIQFGFRVYQMRYFFEEAVGRVDALTGNRAGWNHFWRDDADKGVGWYLAQNTNPVSGNTYAFGTGDFSALFGL